MGLMGFNGDVGSARSAVRGNARSTPNSPALVPGTPPAGAPPTGTAPAAECGGAGRGGGSGGVSGRGARADTVRRYGYLEPDHIKAGTYLLIRYCT